MERDRAGDASTSWLASIGLRLSVWFERWFPDAFALAIVAVAVVALASMAIGNSPAKTAQWFGAGFWDLVAFTMQTTMLIVSGFALNPVSVNAHGQIAVRLALADGREFILRGDPS